MDFSNDFPEKKRLRHKNSGSFSAYVRQKNYEPGILIAIYV